jgi:ornithine cyclodeaminase/alanine dehydrogenase-like protein (mu-crystallin family)
MATADEMLVLDRATVERCLTEVDVLAVVESCLRAHHRRNTELPDEGYLAWTNASGAYSRSVAMLGAVREPGRNVYGLKVINAATSNPESGLDRAGGFAFLFDPETARPRLMAEAGTLSALRTAAYTAVSLRYLGPDEPGSVSVLGCGALARMHLRVLEATVPSLTTAWVYDLVPERAARLADWAATELPRLRTEVAPDAAGCAARSPVLITVTVSAVPYLPESWFSQPAFIAHVSLDDLLPEVFAGAAAIFVDDEELVAANPRRVLGRLISDGKVGRPGSQARPRVTGSLGQVIEGEVAAVRPGAGHVISNPFGLAILDVAVLAAVAEAAQRRGEGGYLNLVDGLPPAWPGPGDRA